MDGISNRKVLRGADRIPSIQLKRDKERSDLGVALEFCESQKAAIVYAFGFQGGRADHDFAVHLDLSTASLRIPHVVSIGERGAVFYVSGKFAPLRLERKSVDALRRAGAPISRQASSVSRMASIFPVGSPVSGLKLRGLRFPALDGILSSSSQGLSNEIKARKIEFRFQRGRLAIFFPA
jgi:thiamine pyrophosphokinase